MCNIVLARLPLLNLALALVPIAASQADPAAGEACAQQLAPPARLIYQATAPEVTKQADLRALLREHTRDLVIAGKIEREAARPAAEAAAGCLKVLRD